MREHGQPARWRTTSRSPPAQAEACWPARLDRNVDSLSCARSTRASFVARAPPASHSSSTPARRRRSAPRARASRPPGAGCGPQLRRSHARRCRAADRAARCRGRSRASRSGASRCRRPCRDRVLSQLRLDLVTARLTGRPAASDGAESAEIARQPSTVWTRSRGCSGATSRSSSLRRLSRSPCSFSWPRSIRSRRA